MAMTREFLKKQIEGITDEQITTIINEAQADKKKAEDDLAAKTKELETVTTERDGLKTQIADRDKDIKDLQKKVSGQEELEQQVKDLQDKYDKDTKDLNQKLSDQARSHATDNFFSGVEFSSDFAKQGALAAFNEKNFTLDEKTGTFIGGKEGLESPQKKQPAAFKAKDGGSGDGGDNGGAGNGGNPYNPYFSNPNGSQGKGDDGKGGGQNPFSFNFTGVRPHDNAK